MKDGQFQIYTGDGKGKTTAALGLALRACGAGLRVYFCQFIKDRETSEIRALRRLPGVTVAQFGSGRGLRACREPAPEDLSCARAGFDALAAALHSGDYDVVVADEINCALARGLLDEPAVLRLVDQRPATAELVFTGRDAAPALVARADLVTEMRAVKHYYQEKNLPAREGIEM